MMLKNSDPMSFEDLGTIYRMEKKSNAVSAVRRDLYPAMAGLIMNLRAEYEKHLSVDPDSIICEGVNQRRKKAILMSKEITEIRMGKIASLALIGARGGQNQVDHFTSEEREYYDNVLDISRRHVGIMDRLSGKKKFEPPEIDSEPAAEKNIPKPVRVKAEPVPEPVIEDVQPEPIIEKTPADIPKKPKKESVEEESIIIRILEDLPPFSGPDRNYELSKEDIVRMPKDMAMALIRREKAALVNPEP
ncbi:MAG: hypothetical protein LBG63_00985 [Candidatus Methanoplasma sp.]|jgi:DNA replication factor GINS|nr:hypothetical protein [Candidatus Methanoplasma sp.]